MSDDAPVVSTDAVARSPLHQGTREASACSRPPLYGVPVGVKDIFHVDGLPTRAGSAVPPANLAGPQAAAAIALERAGAAGLCPLALGTQTIGSITHPAAFCGVVGVKPSDGRIPIDGLVPVAPSVDHVGYFTQDLAGARLAANVLCEDWQENEAPPPLERVGVVDGPYLAGATDEGRAQFREHVDRLEAAGLEVRHVELFADIEAVNERHQRLVAAETALSHSELYPTHGDRYAEQTRALIEDGREVPVGALCDARAGRTELRRAIHDRMDDHNVDLVASPAAPGPAPEGLDSTGDPIMNLPWTHAGVPTVTVPASKTDAGLSVGLQCATRFGDDERLLRWCRRIRATLE